MINTQVYFYNKNSHIAQAERINELAALKGVSVSRWQNNSKGRVIVTYMVHTGEREQMSTRQTGVQLTVREDYGRGGKPTDETRMMTAIITYLNSIEIETEQKPTPIKPEWVVKQLTLANTAVVEPVEALIEDLCDWFEISEAELKEAWLKGTLDLGSETDNQLSRAWLGYSD